MSSQKKATGSLAEIFTRDFVIIMAINLLFFFSFQMTSLGLPVYVDSLGASSQIVGLVGTIMVITATVVRIFSGWMLDRFGRKTILVIGGICTLASVIAYAVFPVVAIIMAIRMLHGVGWGMTSTTTSTIAADIVPKHRFAEGLGYFAMTNAISGALAPALALELVQGYGAAEMLVVAGVLVLIALGLAIIQKGGVGASTAKSAAQEDSHASGEEAATAEQRMQEASETSAEARMPEVQAELVEEQAPEDPAEPKEYRGLEKLFDRRALLPGILVAFVNAGYTAITTFLVLFAMQRGIDGASLFFVTYAVVTFVIRPMAGRLVDRIGYRLPCIVSSAFTVLTLVIIGFSTDTWMIVAAGVCSGLGVGTAMSTCHTMAVGRVEPHRRGVATSTYFTIFDIGVAAGSLFGGIAADAMGYSAMFLVMALFPLASFIVSVIAVRK